MLKQPQCTYRCNLDRPQLVKTLDIPNHQLFVMPYTHTVLPTCNPCMPRARRPANLRPCAGVSGAPDAAKRSGLPNEAEDLVVSRTSFVKAYMEAQYNAERIEGLQEFAAAVWERRKRIPSTSYNDPLRRIFVEFDKDGDGHLSADEVASALQSRGVQLTGEVAQKYIDAADLNNNHLVEYEEFEDLIFRMAKADLTGKIQRPEKGPLQRGKSLLNVPVFQHILDRDPTLLDIPGLQEFTSSVWDRQRRVPAPLWHDPLAVTFKEFDRDGDGHLTAEELVAALNTNGVDISLEQAEVIVQAVDTDDNNTVELEEFPALIYGLASLDRASKQRTSSVPKPSS